MSTDDHTSTGTKKRRKKKCNEKVQRERNKQAMRRLRAENPEYCEIERIKNRINSIKTRVFTVTDETTRKSLKEKNKIAMRNRRANDEYRKQENIRNRIAMRMKRKDESIRRRDNERNRIYMQMKRKQLKEFLDHSSDEFTLELSPDEETNNTANFHIEIKLE